MYSDEALLFTAGCSPSGRRNLIMASHHKLDARTIIQARSLSTWMQVLADMLSHVFMSVPEDTGKGQKLLVGRHVVSLRRVRECYVLAAACRRSSHRKALVKAAKQARICERLSPMDTEV